MGPLASSLQSQRFDEQLAVLEDVTDSIFSNGTHEGAFTSPKVLVCHQPMKVDKVHEVEAFGPMTTIMPYDSTEEAIQLANKSDGSLVASLLLLMMILQQK